MEKIIEQIQEWPFLQRLPAELMGFTVKMELSQSGTQYRIFTYHNVESFKSFAVLYDHATKDFLVRITIGLTEYCDVDFITTSLETFDSLLKGRMERTLSSLALFDKTSLSKVFLEKKILDWGYSNPLPGELAGFTCYIRPDEPLKVLNGSYIIIDYSDFQAESNLIIYYNIFRDEFFGEMRIKRTPLMVTSFDAKNVQELQEKLDKNLQTTLDEMRQTLAQAT